MIWCRWRYGGEDPYLVYNGADARIPPQNRDRVEAFKDACALYANEVEWRQAGAKLKSQGRG